MLLRLAPEDPRPLYEQIASAVRAALASGELAPGDRLPAGRDLADALGVNLDTVQRAYRELADDGIVVSRVGRGTAVAADLDPAHLSLTEEIQAVVSRARSLGIGADALADMVRRAMTPDP